MAQSCIEQDSSWEKGFEGSLLTNAAQALLPSAHQHDMAEVAVGWFLEMLHGPGVPPVPLGALRGQQGNEMQAAPLFLKRVSSHIWKTNLFCYSRIHKFILLFTYFTVVEIILIEMQIKTKFFVCIF